jgi:hypothetical protein
MLSPHDWPSRLGGKDVRGAGRRVKQNAGEWRYVAGLRIAGFLIWLA